LRSERTAGIVGQALPPARIEWFDRQECLSYNALYGFTAV